MIIDEAKLLNGITEEVDTFQGWQRKGCKVKRGEHAAFATEIWHPRKSKKVNEETKEESEEFNGNYFKKKAFFFTSSQVDGYEEEKADLVSESEITESLESESDITESLESESDITESLESESDITGKVKNKYEITFSDMTKEIIETEMNESEINEYYKNNGKYILMLACL